MLKAVIFDMDGLLIDSEPLWRQSHVEVLGEHGIVITEDDVRAMAGRRTLDVTGEWRKRFGIARTTDEALADRIVAKVIELVHLNGAALPGVYRLVAVLYKHKIPMAVASSSSMELINVVLDRLDLHKYMKAVHSGVDEARGKPFPDVFLSTANALAVEPQDCLVFEDSLNGVKAAKAAGMKCVAVPEHPHDPVVFDEAGADKIVTTLEQLSYETLLSL